MSSAPHLFVYGTLQSWCLNNRYARYLASQADLVGPARIQGRLYALKRYPGLRPPLNPGEWAVGEIYRLRQPRPHPG
ncbi:MAG: gamma-glutamylcyclotransferase family protein [Acidobacteriota bacterium]